jgi:hypothetical protein
MEAERFPRRHRLSLDQQSLGGGRHVFGIVGATNVANETKDFRSAQAFRVFGRFGAASGANRTKEFTTQVTARTARCPQHYSFWSMTTVTQRATDPHKPEENPFLSALAPENRRPQHS